MTRRETETAFAGLRTIVVGESDAPMFVVLCHGYAMTPEDLSPFAHALDLSAQWFFPEAALTTEPQSDFARRRCWWPMDPAMRAAELAGSPRDFADVQPAGLPRAREQLGAFVDEVLALARGRPVVVGGFSSGGMLAFDTQLHMLRPIAALMLLSSTRIAFAEEQPRLSGLGGLPILIAHGHADHELAFAAGEELRNAAIAGGADVTWLPFDGGHEIPLVVWRGLRQFLQRLT